MPTSTVRFRAASIRRKAGPRVKSCFVVGLSGSLAHSISNGCIGMNGQGRRSANQESNTTASATTTGASVPSSSGGSISGATLALIIVPSVVLPILCILAILVAVFYIRKLRRQKRMLHAAESARGPKGRVPSPTTAWGKAQGDAVAANQQNLPPLDESEANEAQRASPDGAVAADQHSPASSPELASGAASRPISNPPSPLLPKQSFLSHSAPSSPASPTSPALDGKQAVALSALSVTSADIALPADLPQERALRSPEPAERLAASLASLPPTPKVLPELKRVPVRAYSFQELPKHTEFASLYSARGPSQLGASNAAGTPRNSPTPKAPSPSIGGHTASEDRLPYRTVSFPSLPSSGANSAEPSPTSSPYATLRKQGYTPRSAEALLAHTGPRTPLALSSTPRTRPVLALMNQQQPAVGEPSAHEAPAPV